VEPTDSAYAAEPSVGFDGAIIRIHPQRLISAGIDNDDSFRSNARNFDN
jgi:hypothetical protein